VRAAFVTLRRLHVLAAHRHAAADRREAYTGTKCFHQQLALKRAVAMTWLTDEFNDRLKVIPQSRTQIVHSLPSAHAKKFPLLPSN
jgi:hypothetical protein